MIPPYLSLPSGPARDAARAAYEQLHPLSDSDRGPDLPVSEMTLAEIQLIARQFCGPTASIVGDELHLTLCGHIETVKLRLVCEPTVRAAAKTLQWKIEHD